MKKLFVLFFVFFVLPAVVLGTEYTITEAELSRLEEISENLETYKRNQQLQVQSLKKWLTEALNKSNTLKGQLQMERETLKSLRQSYAEYEKELDIKIQEYETLIDKFKNKLYKARLTIALISCFLGFLLLSSIIFFIVKIKLKFF